MRWPGVQIPPGAQKIKNMKIIPTKEYLLLIDEEAEIIPNKTICLNLGGDVRISFPFIPTKDVIGCAVKLGKILAYYPLTKEAKELDLPWLPNPFISVEQKAKSYANNHWTVEGNHTDLYEAFIAGCKSIQPKQFSLEDIRESFRAGLRYADDKLNLPDSEGKISIQEPSEDEYIQSLSTQQLPEEFDITLNDGVSDVPYSKVIELCNKINYSIWVIKTTTNSEGKQQLVGTYK